MTSLPAQPNRSLIEGIEVLLAVAQRQEPVGVRALARELNMTPTRVQRFLGTLAHLGLTDQKADRRYGVGPGIHALSAISLTASGLSKRALSILPGLADLDLIIALGVLWRDTVNYLYFNSPPHSVSESLGNQSGYPARESSIGLLLLAHHQEDYLQNYFPAEKAEILPVLKPIRTQGYAMIQRPDGEISLAVPVGSPPVAGLAASGHFPAEKIPTLVARLQKAASQIDSTSFPICP